MSRRSGTPPRLTIFSAAWQPIEGGAEKQLRQVAEILADRGWQVRVFAGAARGAEGASRDDRGIDVRRLTAAGHDGLPTGTELTARMLLAASTTDADVVIGSLVSGASLAAVTYGHLRRRPVVLRIGGHDFERLNTSWPRRQQGRYLVRGSSLVVVNAPHLAQQVVPFTGRHGPRVTTIRNGVAIDVAPTSLAVERSGPLRVLYYTNAGEPKNDPAFLKIVAAVPTALFRAVGRTDHLPDLANLDRRGWCDDIGPELAWADVVLNTSTSEGSPNLCMQALAVGRPVVGFANRGIIDLAESYPDAVSVVPMNDVSGACGILASRDWRQVKVKASVPSLGYAADQWEEWLIRVSALSQ